VHLDHVEPGGALLATVGGVVGVALGIAGSRVLATLVPDDVRRVQDIGLDFTLLLFALSLTILSAALFGVFPALQSVRSVLAHSVRSGREGTSRSTSNTRRALVVVQLAMAVMLLTGAGLLMRSFAKMQTVDLGYRADGGRAHGSGFPGSPISERAGPGSGDGEPACVSPTEPGDSERRDHGPAGALDRR